MTSPCNSRKVIAMMTALLYLMTTLCGCQVQDSTGPEDPLAKSMKGYELYSWEYRGEWHFALLEGTNQINTGDEVTAQEVRVQGIEALRSALDELPEGEQVFWSAESAPNMAFKDEKVVAQIKKHCRQSGIKLEIVR